MMKEGIYLILILSPRDKTKFNVYRWVTVVWIRCHVEPRQSRIAVSERVQRALFPPTRVARRMLHAKDDATRGQSHSDAPDDGKSANLRRDFVFITSLLLRRTSLLLLRSGDNKCLCHFTATTTPFEVDDDDDDDDATTGEERAHAPVIAVAAAVDNMPFEGVRLSLDFACSPIARGCVSRVVRPHSRRTTQY